MSLRKSIAPHYKVIVFVSVFSLFEKFVAKRQNAICHKPIVYTEVFYIV